MNKNIVAGDILWTKNYGSPVVGIYLFDSEGLRKVGINHIAKETLVQLIGSNATNDEEGTSNTFRGDKGEIVLQYVY